MRVDKTCVHVWYQIKFAQKGVRDINEAKEYLRFLIMPMKSRMAILKEMEEMGLISLKDNKISIVGYEVDEDLKLMNKNTKTKKHLEKMEEIM